MVAKFPPCWNDTVLDDRPLVYDQLLRWHTQGNCLRTQTVRNRLYVVALVAPVEIQAPMVVKELLRVVAAQVL